MPTITSKAKVAEQLNAQSPYHAHSFWYIEDASPTILASQKAINEFLFPHYIKFLHKDKWKITYENIQGEIPTKIKKYCPDRIKKELGAEVIDFEHLCNLYAEYYFKTGILPTKNKVANIINTNSRQWAQQFLYLIYPEHITESIKKSLRDSQKIINEFLLPRGQKLIFKSEAQAVYKSIKLEIPPIIAKLHSPKIRSTLGFTPIDFEHLCNAFSAYYFTTTRFNAIKERIAKYIAECNELNTHIENLTDENLYAQKPDYGEVSTIDTSFYNYSRPHYLQNKSDKNTYYTNNINLYKKAEAQPFLYFCKYFDIDKNEKSLQDFEASLNGFCAIEEGKAILKIEKDKILESISLQIPPIIQHYDAKSLDRNLGFAIMDLNTITFPEFYFHYESAGGRSSMYFPIVFSIENLERFISYLAREIQRKKSIKYQRALMSKGLREFIKARDHYTCRHCGNSTNNEPNLLLEIDHIIPLSKGGLSTEENLQTLCWRCNRSKGAKLESSLKY